jgi:cell wall-associated NlpC family hydrolase
MRRVMVTVLAAVSALTLISFAALSASAQTEPSDQHATEEPLPQGSTTPPPEVTPADSSPSQGSFTEGTAGPNEPSLVADTPPSASETDDLSVTARGGKGKGGKGNKVVRAARRYLGTKYRYATCSRSRMSCTCLTKKTWAKFGHKLPMSEKGQWNYKRGRKVAKSKLRPGDIVFFKEGGRKRGITHVGIYSGKGNLIHASAYFRKVVESKMKYIRGYSGAKRLKRR